MSPPESAGPFAPGGAFERLGVLETLSYGVVWEGKRFEASQAEPLTFLELDRAFQRDRDALEQLLDALAAAGKLAGAGVAPAHGVWLDGDSFYLVGEELTGLSLARAFEVLAAVGARLSTEAILRVIGAILSALDQAAKQFPGSEDAAYGHGLLTSENVFLAEGQRVLVRGFGFWPAVSRAGLLRPTTARYLSPVQLRTGAGSPRADLFSLATILFELVCGVPAFDGPPDDEGVSSLKETIEERQKEAEAPLLPLYGAMLACLSSGLPAPVFRSRLRMSVDTLFLEELPRERGPKTFSIEDLLGRVKPRRPAVVKARTLTLSPAEPGRSTAVDLLAGAPALEPAAAEPERSPTAAGAAEAPVLARPSPPPPASFFRANPWSLLLTVLSFGVLVVLAGIFAASALRSRLSPTRAPAQPSARIALATPTEAPMALAAEETPSQPAPAVPLAVSPVAPSGAGRVAPAEAASPRRKRQAVAARGPAGRGNPGLKRPGSLPVDGAEGAAVSQATAPAPSILPGSLVPLDTPGLVRPVVSEAPEIPRYGASDPREAVTRTALLEILVDEEGLVRGSRILRVESPPPGFSSGLERYLSRLRFRPARAGEAPVRVWIPYELKYLAP